MTVESIPAQPSIRAQARRDVWSYLQPAASSQSTDEDIRVVVDGRVLAFSSEKALAILKAGISSRSVEPLAEFFGIGKGQLVEYLDLERTTALRRAMKDQPLPRHAAERVLRLLELDEIAAGTFDSEEAALGWLRRAHPLLDGETPLQAASTSFGAQRVKDILVAIKYGGAA